ncbi:YitT family protein [Parasutterella sp.]|uniref:YczE/YyaS/YitT family protein n=1 Tax=Parasutterella sp. TaxID=2049037 RepID=UPI003520E017
MFRKLGQWFIFVAALFVMSLGIALVTRGNLGTTPISSLPLVSSYASGLTFGETTFFINLLFVAAQWLLLRQSINKLLLLSQIPITFAFSYFIDTSMQFTEFLSSDVYWKCLVVSMLGNVVLGLGVALEVFSDARGPARRGTGACRQYCSAKAIFIRQNRPMTLFWFCWLYFLVTAFSTKYAGCGKELLFRRYASASL